MKAVYIGAGIDTSPIENFKNIKIFYYIDSQPNSEFGIKQSGIKLDNGMDGFYRPNFISKLNDNMKNVGLKLVNIYDDLRIYSNNKQIVYYYTNTAIPEHYDKLKDKIKNFDTLFVFGHDPDSIFLNATSKKIHFIGNQGTSYINNEFDNENSIIYKMHHTNLSNKFSNFTYLSNTKKIYNFDNWNKFYNFYKKKNEEDVSQLFLKNVF
jgi:hypothetical protein